MNNAQIELVLTQYLKDLKKTSSEKEMSEIIEIMNVFLTETNKKQLEESISKLQQLSKSDGPCRMASIWLLGFCNLEGYIVSKNLELAIQYFEQAAKENFAPAINHLGYCYGAGMGVQQDTKWAFELYSKASKLNFTIAQHNVGLCYKAGTGVEKDQKIAFDYFSRVAKEEFINAQYELGMCYMFKLGTTFNFDEAVKIFKMLEAGKHSNAAYRLGSLYSNGDKYENLDEAIKFFERACEYGHVDAPEKLAEIFLEEKKPADIKNAIRYYKLGAERGDTHLYRKLIIIYREAKYGVQDLYMVLQLYIKIFKKHIQKRVDELDRKRIDDKVITEIEEIIKSDDIQKILDLYKSGFEPKLTDRYGDEVFQQITSLRKLNNPSKMERFLDGYDLPSGYSALTKELAPLFREYEWEENFEAFNKNENKDEKKEERPKNN